MTPFEIIANLFTQKRNNWINELDDKDIVPVIIQKNLSMSSRTVKYAEILNRFTYSLPPKMYLGLAWSIIQKQSKAPFIRYIKSSKDDEEQYSEILIKVKKLLNLSDNDWKYEKKYYLQYLKDNEVEIFQKLGLDKKVWKKYGVDYSQNKQGKREGKKGLDLFFG